MKYVPLRYLFIGFMLVLLVGISLSKRHGMVSADGNHSILKMNTMIATDDLASAESITTSTPLTMTQVYLALQSIIPDIAEDLQPQTEYCMDLILTVSDNGYQPQERVNLIHIYLSDNFDANSVQIIEPIFHKTPFPIGIPANGMGIYQDGTWLYEGVFDSPSIIGTNYLRWSYQPGASGVDGDAPVCEAGTQCNYHLENHVCATTKSQLDLSNRSFVGTGYATNAQNADLLMYEIPRMLAVSLTDNKSQNGWLFGTLLISLFAGLIVTTATLRRR